MTLWESPGPFTPVETVGQNSVSALVSMGYLYIVTMSAGLSSLPVASTWEWIPWGIGYWRGVFFCF